MEQFSTSVTLPSHNLEMVQNYTENLYISTNSHHERHLNVGNKGN